MQTSDLEYLNYICLVHYFHFSDFAVRFKVAHNTLHFPALLEKTGNTDLYWQENNVLDICFGAR